jgi:hypothetical protein
MKKFLALALIAILPLVTTGCGAPEVVAIIESLTTATINTLQIAGVLSVAQQTQYNALSADAVAAYNAYEAAPAADKTTALAKFQVAFNALTAQINPALQAVAGKNTVLQTTVDLILVQVQSVVSIIVAAQGSNVKTVAQAKAVAPQGKSAADFKTAYNASVQKFGKQYQLPVHGKLVHALTLNQVR